MINHTNDIERYLKGEMNAAERHAFEKKALDDPFLAEALEGAEELQAENFANDVAKLEEKIKSKGKDNKNEKIPAWIWPTRIAAGLVLLVASVYFIIQLSIDPDDNNVPLAMEKSLQTPESTSGPDDSIRRELQDDQKMKGETQEKGKAKSQPGPAKSEEQHLEKEPLTSPAVAQPKDTEVSARTQVEEDRTEPLAKKESRNETAQKSASSRAATPASNYVVRGKITSMDDGSPLPGVNVVIKGTTLGTVSNETGDYQIDLANPNSVLVYSFIGMQSTEAPTLNHQTIDIRLSPDPSQLSEMVITAQAIQQETKALGYAVSSIDEKTSRTVNLAHPETGFRAFKQYLEKNIVYPQEARAKKIEGRVTAEFTIEPDGSLTNFTIVRGIGGGCDEELVRLIKEGPTWLPTNKAGVPLQDKARVRLKFELPR